MGVLWEMGEGGGEGVGRDDEMAAVCRCAAAAAAHPCFSIFVRKAWTHQHRGRSYGRGRHSAQLSQTNMSLKGDGISKPTRVVCPPPAKRGATCHHAGQLLRPGDGADAARLHDGRGDFAGPSLLPVSSQDGCEGLLIEGVHHVSGGGHVGIPARTKHTQPN